MFLRFGLNGIRTTNLLIPRAPNRQQGSKHPGAHDWPYQRLPLPLRRRKGGGLAFRSGVGDRRTLQVPAADYHGVTNQIMQRASVLSESNHEQIDDVERRK